MCNWFKENTPDTKLLEKLNSLRDEISNEMQASCWSSDTDLQKRFKFKHRLKLCSDALKTIEILNKKLSKLKELVLKNVASDSREPSPNNSTAGRENSREPSLDNSIAGRENEETCFVVECCNKNQNKMAGSLHEENFAEDFLKSTKNDLDTMVKVLKKKSNMILKSKTQFFDNEWKRNLKELDKNIEDAS